MAALTILALDPIGLPLQNLHPVTIKYEIKTCGYKPGTPEKERYQTLQYSPAILTPDSQGRVELWKRWPVKPTPSAVIPPGRAVPVQPAGFSSSSAKHPSHSVDPRQPNGGSKSSKVLPAGSKLVVTGHTSFSEFKRKRGVSEDTFPASAMEDSAQVALSKKARKRLNAELAAVQATSGKAAAAPLPSGVVGAAPSSSSHPDTLNLLQSVNQDLQREIECLKVYERNRTLKREVDQLRSQLGLPPADPLGLEAKMISLGFAPATPSQESSPRGQASGPIPQSVRSLNGIDTFDGPSDRDQSVNEREESVGRWPHDKWFEQQSNGAGASHRRGSASADAGSQASVHATPRQPVMNQDRLKMLAQKADEPIDHPVDEWDMPIEAAGDAGRLAATGANSDPVVPSSDNGGHPVPKRRWGAVKIEPGADDLPSEPQGACEAQSAPGPHAGSEHRVASGRPPAPEQQSVPEDNAVSEQQRCAHEQQSFEEQQPAEEPEQGEVILVPNRLQNPSPKREEGGSTSPKASAGADVSAGDSQGKGEPKTERVASPPINNGNCCEETKVEQLTSPIDVPATSETGRSHSPCKDESITA